MKRDPTTRGPATKLEQVRLRLGITSVELSRVAGYTRQHVLTARYREPTARPVTKRFRRDLVEAIRKIVRARARRGDKVAAAALRRGIAEADLF